MQYDPEQNKIIVTRFNKEFIEQDNMDTFRELVSDVLVNHAAPPGWSTGPDGMIHSIQEVLKKAFPDLEVEILDQVAEGDKVATRKVFHATHKGDFMGVKASNKKVLIQSIEIIRIKDGKYVERWGMSNLSEIINKLRSLGK